MKNKGISLITLVITIIIMIILAGAIILSLTNSGIFDKANEATDTYSLKQVQAIADLAWSEAYADNKRDKDSLQTAVDDALKANGLEGKYTAIADEKGVTVSKVGDQGNGGQGGTANVPTNWQENVVAIVDGVPIPKGFVASPYDGTDGMPAENTKAGGLVIYALNEGETSATDIREADKAEYTDLKDIHYNSMETRNQFVWVPVDKENFATEFVRDGFGRYDLSSTVEIEGVYWELALEDGNTPSDTQGSYVSDATLTEAKAMYASVKEYGGFYIARYEAGTDEVDEWGYSTGNISITMGKYPYNSVMWAYDMIEEDDDGRAVDLARKFYPNTSDNTTGVVSTLTYGVQWDTTLNWWKKIDPEFNLEDSTNYGNYFNTAISSAEYNANAKCSSNGGSWEDAVEKTYDEENDVGNRLFLTTGAFKNANVNNIYDMAGNFSEWTMEGHSSNYRIIRDGSCAGRGNRYPVIHRDYLEPVNEYNDVGFRPSLYIKQQH